MDASKWDSFGEAYDVKSVMQYPGDAFSYNGQPSIIDRQTGRAVPWNTKVSQSDYAQLNAMYPCDDPGLDDNSSDSDDSDQVEDPDCVDRSGNCAAWAEYGFCDHGSQSKYMVSNCKRSCGLCGCQDSDPVQG